MAMHLTQPLLWILAGAAAGIATLLACGDDTPGAADAATCDCQGFEPALTAQRVYRVRQVFPVITGDDSDTESTFVSCKSGDVVLGGGCYVFVLSNVTTPNKGPTVISPPNYPLQYSFPTHFHDSDGKVTGTAESWQCGWGAPNPRDPDVRLEADAICLDLKPD